MLIKSAIDKFHPKNAAVLEFKPALVETRILRKKRLQCAIYKRLWNSTDMLSKCILSAIWMTHGLTNVNRMAQGKNGAVKTAREIHVQVI